jgi:hypothetical protein
MTGTEEETPDVEHLLPWYAAGTLNDSDTARVEQALTADPDLARRYALAREERAETIRLNEELGPPPRRVADSLFARIEAEPKRAFRFTTLLTGFVASLSPRTLAWSATIALAAILLQAGLIADFALTGRGSFETASAPSMPSSIGTFVFIRFIPQATVEDINRLLDANKSSIVDGPAPGGLYKVRVAQTMLSDDELERLVKTLQDNRLVAFIGTAH